MNVETVVVETVVDLLDAMVVVRYLVVAHAGRGSRMSRSLVPEPRMNTTAEVPSATESSIRAIWMAIVKIMLAPPLESVACEGLAVALT